MNRHQTFDLLSSTVTERLMGGTRPGGGAEAIWSLLRGFFAPGSAPASEDERSELGNVRRRDPKALDAFFSRHFEGVYSFAARWTGDASTAEDVTQEVFLRLYRAIDDLDPDRDPRPWILTIAANVCRDRWRSRAHQLSRHSVSIDHDAEAVRRLADESDGADRQLDREERSRLVQDALARLPDDLRAIVLLRDYRGLGHEAIAAGLGLSPAAARKRYSRALAQLATMLSPYFG